MNSRLTDALGAAVVIIPWIIGIFFAHGFWSTSIACIFPSWAWYLVAEHWLR